jgi:hypothetical protein
MPQTVKPPLMRSDIRLQPTRIERRTSWALGLAPILLLLAASACKPDDAPLKAENETLRKQLTRQESVLNSLQDGTKVMQQQIDLLNQELRDAKKETQRAHDETEHVRAEAKEVTLKFEAQVAQTKKLSAEVQRTAAAQAAFTVRAEEKGAQFEDLPRPFALVARAAEEALGRNGYAIRVSVKTDQKAVYVTERKVSPPASLEASGFRNQFLIALQIPSASVTRLSVKAEFEKLAQGGRILTAGPDETAEIERRLIAEISKAVAAKDRL